VKFAPFAVKAGAVVIDNSSAFRMDPDVPLVIPEINANRIGEHRGIIANPNCSAITALVPLWPIHQINRIKCVGDENIIARRAPDRHERHTV
jgi:aspartate-semialdehyde dehydrogenase